MTDHKRSGVPNRMYSCRVFTKSDNSNIADPFTEVFVKNLDPWYDRDDKVEDLFKPCGLITHVRLVRNEQGHAIGVAYVTFAEPHMALKACQTLNGIKNRYGLGLYVDRSFTRREWQPKVEKPKTVGAYRVFVKNLHYRVTKEALFNRFERFGDILSTNVARNEYGVSLCHGVVVFLTKESAERAINEGHGMTLYNMPLLVDNYLPLRKKPEPKTTTGRKLFVKGVLDRDTLNKLFEMYGKIEDIYVVNDKGIAFVTFTDKSMADRALANISLIKTMVPGRALDIQLAEPEKKPVLAEFECKLCFDTKSIEEVLPVECEHRFCWKCMAKYLEWLINEGVSNLLCPEPGCEIAIDDKHVDVLVDKEFLDKYKLMLTDSGKVNTMVYGKRAIRQYGTPVN